MVWSAVEPVVRLRERTGAADVPVAAMVVVMAAWGTSLTHGGAERAALYTVDAVMDLTGKGAHVIFDAAGKTASINASIRSARRKTR